MYGDLPHSVRNGIVVAPVLLLVVIGLVLTLRGICGWHRAVASKYWPAARGVVIKSWLGSETATEDTDEVPYDVIYEYEVAGRGYLANVIRFGSPKQADPSWAREIAARYPVGASVTAYYNPRRPQVAVLERGLVRPSNQLTSLLVGAVMLVLSLFLACMMLDILFSGRYDV